MLNHQVPSAAEKIKELRKYLGITQDELAKSLNRTRTTISKIENQSQPVTYIIATELANAFKTIAIKKDIDIGNIDNLYFLNLNKHNIDNVAEEHIKELSEICFFDYDEAIKERVNTISDFFINNNVHPEKKYEFYDIIIGFYLRSYRFKECKILIIKALEIATELRRPEYSLKLFCNLIRVYAYLKDFDEIILLEKNLGSFSNNEKTKSFFKSIYYNTARAYGEKGEYDNMIKYLNKILSDFSLTDQEVLDIEILKIFTELKRKNYSLAEEQYLKLLDTAIIIKNNITAVRVYAGLAKLYYEKNKLSESCKYIGLVLESDEAKKMPDILATVNEIKLYISCKTSADLIETKEAFEAFISDKNIAADESLQVNVIKEMYIYCSYNKHYDYLLEMINIIDKKILSKEINSQEVFSVYMEICNTFKEIKSCKHEEVFNRLLRIVRLNGQ